MPHFSTCCFAKTYRVDRKHTKRCTQCNKSCSSLMFDEEHPARLLDVHTKTCKLCNETWDSVANHPCPVELEKRTKKLPKKLWDKVAVRQNTKYAPHNTKVVL